MTPRDKVIKTEQDFTAIPYYAWANRGRGEMIVWLPNNESSVKLPAAADNRFEEQGHARRRTRTPI